jgi:hypothetical protein
MLMPFWRDSPAGPAHALRSGAVAMEERRTPKEATDALHS